MATPLLNADFQSGFYYSQASPASDSSNAITVAVEKCQLCDGCKKSFICSTCVKHGNFTYSYQHKQSRSSHCHSCLSKASEVIDNSSYIYSQKFLRDTSFSSEDSINRAIEEQSYQRQKKLLYDLMSERNLLHSKILKYIGATQERNDKVCLLNEKRELIAKLSSAVLVANKQLEAAKTKLKEKRRQNDAAVEQYKRYQLKKEKLKNLMEGRESHAMLDKKAVELNKVNARLCNMRVCHIKQISKYIFPVEHVKFDPNLSATEGSGVDQHIALLADAVGTIYVNGRWMQRDHMMADSYQIVQSLLPGDGTYTHYKPIENKTESPTPQYNSADVNPVCELTSGLAYTVQLVNLLSSILDIRLPIRQTYSKFAYCGLSEEDFHRHVAYLNNNILYLCFSQHIKPEDVILPNQTLYNLSKLLEAKELGRSGCFEVSSSLVQSFTEHPDMYESYSNDLPHNRKRVEHLEDYEWEDIGASQTQLIEEEMLASNQQYSDYTSSTSTLVSSAAASFTSYFRKEWL